MVVSYFVLQRIDRALSDATIPGQSEAGSNDNKAFPLLQHHWNLTIWLFRVISRTLIGGGLSLSLSLQRGSLCILQP